MADPGTAAIAFAAASTAIGGLGYLEQSRAAKSQLNMDLAASEMAQEQGRMQGAEAAAANALQFRKALASQVALASLRGGSGSVVRQFGSESFSNFLQDQQALASGVRLSDTRALNAMAQARGNRYATDVKGLTSFATNALNAWNMNQIFGGTGGKK